MLLRWLFIITLQWYFITSIKSSHIRISRQTNNNCVTPDNQQGTCTPINRCQPLNTLLVNRAREPAIQNFLRQSRCGTGGSQASSTRVCCPNSGSTRPPTSDGISTTTSTTTTTPRTQSSRNTLTSSGRPQVESSITGSQFAECGRISLSSLGTRVVDGKDSELGAWPWMAALGYRTPPSTAVDFKCGGTLISQSWIVTASHCLLNIGNLQIASVRLGDLNLNSSVNDGASPVDIPVGEVITHPDFTANPAIINDVALIRLQTPVTFTRLIRPLCILQKPEHLPNTFYEGKMPFIVGWGRTGQYERSSNQLKEAQINFIKSDKCKQQFSAVRGALIDDRVLCAGNGKKDACQGDSGGPLIVAINANGTKFYLAGIVSFGYGCGNTDNYPGVYTKVAAFASWIEETINSKQIL